MIRVTNNQAGAYSAAHEKLEDVALDNERGMAAAELNALVLSRVQAFRMRVKALQKERQKLVEDHALRDAKGAMRYSNPENPDPNQRVLLWKTPIAATKALEAWQTKFEELTEQVIEIDSAPLRDDFFTKPAEFDVKQAVRTAFLPFLAKNQKVAEKPTKRRR